ncbi:hypothetical protein, partial [Rhodococcus sp. KBW08]|uniref:hypothetical protein n=1 Tax=Rhodococcus sp. KBW08 TaxID=2144188 RepID=UPI001C8AE99B
SNALWPPWRSERADQLIGGLTLYKLGHESASNMNEADRHGVTIDHRERATSARQDSRTLHSRTP